MKSVSQTGAEAAPDFRALVKLLVSQHIFLFGYASALQNRAVLTACGRRRLRARFEALLLQ